MKSRETSDCLPMGRAHREGVPAPEALELIRQVAKLPGLRLQGLWTHLAAADEEGNPATDRQLSCFAELCQRVEA
ncbi:MAG: hypothetical protein C4320_00825, partial [Armatimonadota bacterium]